MNMLLLLYCALCTLVILFMVLFQLPFDFYMSSWCASFLVYSLKAYTLGLSVDLFPHLKAFFNLTYVENDAFLNKAPV